MDAKGRLCGRPWALVLGEWNLAESLPLSESPGGVRTDGFQQEAEIRPLEGHGLRAVRSEKKASVSKPEVWSGTAQRGQRLSKLGRLFTN